MELTLVDGKIHAVLSQFSNSSQCCSVCGISPSDITKLDVILAKKCNVQDQNLQYGLSTLHAWIRFLEYFLHVAYRKEI